MRKWLCSYLGSTLLTEWLQQNPVNGSVLLTDGIGRLRATDAGLDVDQIFSFRSCVQPSVSSGRFTSVQLKCAGSAVLFTSDEVTLTNDLIWNQAQPGVVWNDGEAWHSSTLQEFVLSLQISEVQEGGSGIHF